MPLVARENNLLKPYTNMLIPSIYVTYTLMKETTLQQTFN